MMGDRVTPAQEPIPARIKLYNLNVTGPSTDGDEAFVTGLGLDHVVTVLLMLQVGDCARVECVEETTDWRMAV